MSDLRKQVSDALNKHVTANNPGHSHNPTGSGESPEAADERRAYADSGARAPRAEGVEGWEDAITPEQAAHDRLKIKPRIGDGKNWQRVQRPAADVWDSLEHLEDGREDLTLKPSDAGQWAADARQLLIEAASEFMDTPAEKPLTEAATAFRDGNFATGRRKYDEGRRAIQDYANSGPDVQRKMPNKRFKAWTALTDFRMR